MFLAEILAYDLPDGNRIERCTQREGAHKWALRKLGECMNRSGDMEAEPQPSSRSDDFLDRCRFPSAERAYEIWVLNQRDAGTDLADSAG